MKGKNTVAVVVYLPAEEAAVLDDYILNRFKGSVSRSQFVRETVNKAMKRRRSGGIINA